MRRICWECKREFDDPPRDSGRAKKYCSKGCATKVGNRRPYRPEKERRRYLRHRHRLLELDRRRYYLQRTRIEVAENEGWPPMNIPEPLAPGLRRCGRCKRALPLGWFVKNGSRSNGTPRLRHCCRECLKPKRVHDRVIRNHRIRATAERITEAALKKLAAAQNHLCACGCGASIRDTFHVDHRTPLAKGGTHRLSNLQLLTPLCNLRKGSRWP